MWFIIGRRVPPLDGILRAVLKIIYIIAGAIYHEIRTALCLGITRASELDTLPTAGCVLRSAGAVAPQYRLAAIIYHNGKAAIIVGLKKSAAELGKLVELLFFCDSCHNL